MMEIRYLGGSHNRRDSGSNVSGVEGPRLGRVGGDVSMVGASESAGGLHRHA